VDELMGGAASSSLNLRSIVDRVRPAVSPLLARVHGREALLAEAVRANVRASVEALKHGSELIERLVREDGLLIVGGAYSLESGVVDFIEGVPSLRR